MINLFLEVDDFDPREFKACSNEEINKLMELYNYEGGIPSSLKKFLLFGGHGTADMRPFSGFYFNSMINMKKRFFNGFNRNFPVLKIKRLPADGLLFCESEGYYYEFIVLSESDDPKVYAFDDDPERDDFDIEYDSFSHAIEVFIKDYLVIHQKRIFGKEKLRKYLNEFKKTLLDTIQVIEILKNSINDEWLEQVLNGYYNVKRDVYKLYNNNEVSFDISYELDNEKRIDRINIPSFDKNILLNLNKELNKKFEFLKKLKS